MQPALIERLPASLHNPLRRWTQLSSPVARYLLPFLAIGLALFTHAGIASILPKGTDFPFAFLYLIAIFVVAWFAGYAPGALSCILLMVGFPATTGPGFRLSRVDPSRLTIMLALSLAISGVAQAQRRRRESLSHANDELDKRVQSRTQALALAVDSLQSEIAQHKTTEQRLQSQLERLGLLDQITRAIGERQDLPSIFQVVVSSLENSLPIDFGCVFVYDSAAKGVNVACVGARSEPLARQLAITQKTHLTIDESGLSRCVLGQLLYESDISEARFPFVQRLSQGGLRSLVAAPLLVEKQVFGILIAARRQSESFSSAECEFLRQLTEHVALAANQSQVNAALQQAYDDLHQTQQTVMRDERLRALGQMSSGIAHDINNAISPVALYTEMLLEQEPNLSERTRSYLETTQRAIHDVAHTVARMRQFYRQEEEQLTLNPVDVTLMAQQVLDLTRARWSDMPQQLGHVIQLRTHFAEGLPAVAGIESEIREALTNLVFNAVDAMPDGGILTLRTKVSSAGHIEVEVTDTGVGMDEETRRRCLEPFFTTKGERGTGLGLAMVFGVAQRHDAEVAIDSTVGEGTTVRLSFPVLAAAPAESADATASADMLPALHILVVDDDPLLSRSLRDTLESDGHTVTTAPGGQEGINIFRAAEDRNEPFALVITDLGMPYVDGRKVACAVKTACPSAPVIMLTGWGQRLIAEEDIPAHVDRVLNKPPKLRDLRTALMEVTTRSTSATPA